MGRKKKGVWKTLSERLIPEPHTGCWLFDGYWKRQGRGVWGRVFRDGKTLAVGRASYLEFKGDIPTGMDVLHSCDVGVCGNPDHVYLGTHADNMEQMVKRGRGRSRNSPDIRSAKGAYRG